MVWTLLLACSNRPLTVHAPSSTDAAFTPFVEHVPDERVRLDVSDDPSTGGRGTHVVVALDRFCVECFELTADGDVITVHAGDVLGAQYGVAAVMEAAGFRFFTPFSTHVPERIQTPDALPQGVQSPDMRRRGLHMHTLHPIEGMYAFWMPGDDNQDRAQAVIDWVIKQRGNHVQWVSLEDIESPAVYEPWLAHSTALVDHAHDRGLTVGVGVQLFSEANLQLAFDLVDDPDGDLAEQMDAQWALLTGPGFDLYNLSFGEFSDADPDAFLDAVDLSYARLQDAQPGAEMTTVLHVGDDLQVEYQGETMVYYLLAQFADPEITPWVHTVMFYNLFEDAGGAYHHDEFDQHRELLLERIEQGQPVGYFPESAYWVAFDNSVPQYFPLYIRSRWLDMRTAADETGTGIDDHVLFSSGWEWGYWQNDYATLRMNWSVPDDYETVVQDMFAVYDPTLAEVVVATAELQRDALIEQRLAAWIVGVDNVMELGYGLDIVSQPERPQLKHFDQLDDAQRDEIAQVVVDLRAYAAELAALQERMREGHYPDEIFVREVVHGLEIDRLRALHAADVTQGVLEDDVELLDAAEARLPSAYVAVYARHDDLHAPDPSQILDPGSNPTLYQFGYLHRADTLCYWERELAQARNVVEDAELEVPGCSL
jgi:hypothetical protein